MFNKKIEIQIGHLKSRCSLLEDRVKELEGEEKIRFGMAGHTTKWHRDGEFNPVEDEKQDPLSLHSRDEERKALLKKAFELFEPHLKSYLEI
jgi:hypothetical protein